MNTEFYIQDIYVGSFTKHTYSTIFSNNILKEFYSINYEFYYQFLFEKFIEDINSPIHANYQRHCSSEDEAKAILTKSFLHFVNQVFAGYNISSRVFEDSFFKREDFYFKKGFLSNEIIFYKNSPWGEIHNHAGYKPTKCKYSCFIFRSYVEDLADKNNLPANIHDSKENCLQYSIELFIVFVRNFYSKFNKFLK